MYLTDGFSTLLTISYPTNAVTLYLREREVQPPALDAGGSIEISTMRNKYMRTFAAKQLITLGELTLQCQYDPQIYSQMLAIITEGFGAGNPPPGRVTGTRPRLGASASIQLLFPDAKVLTFWGFVDKVTPPSHKEGEFPVMEVKIVPTNRTMSDVEHIPTLA